MLSETIKPLEPHERIELELFRRCLQDAAESDVTGSDIAQLMNTTTDLLASGAMGKDDAIRGLVHCLIVRVKSYRDECLAHRKEAEQWHAKLDEAKARIAELEEKNKKLLEALEGIIENAAIEIDEQRHMIDSDEAQLQYDQAKMRLDFAKRIKDGRSNAF